MAPARATTIRLVALTVIAGTGGPQKATITLDVDGQHETREATGNGPVDAIFNAIKRDRPARGEAVALPGPRGDRGHRRPGRRLGPARGGRQDRHRPRRRHRHDGRLGQGLCLGAQQARHAPGKSKPEALKAGKDATKGGGSAPPRQPRLVAPTEKIDAFKGGRSAVPIVFCPPQGARGDRRSTSAASGR